MFNNKAKRISQALRDKYESIAILLHGSRAVGKERKHSDWDIIMLFEEEISRRSYREKIVGEDVEWTAFMFPIQKIDFLETFGVYLQFAKVLWERDQGGTDLLELASEVYSKGPNLSEDDIRREKQFLEHKLLGMQDDMNTPYMFLRHLGVFFNRASNLWFEILHNKFPKPFYLAIPEIKQQDPEYARHLIVLASNQASNQEKIKFGEHIMTMLFD